MLKQTLQQKLLQKLSPQQIQLMKLLQVPTSMLEQRIKEEMEINPALDESIGDDDEDKREDDKENDDQVIESNTEDENESVDEEAETTEENYEDDYEDRSKETVDDNFNIDEYLSDYDDSPDYKYNVRNKGSDDDNYEVPVIVTKSFSDTLLAQLGEHNFNEKQQAIAEQLIGSIDDDGYLRRDLSSVANDLAFSKNITTDERELMEVLKVIQSFDPAGTGARTLQECLLLQLERMNRRNEVVRLSLRIIRDYFEEFSRKHFDKIQNRLALNDQEFKEVMAFILKLNPRPGSTYAEAARSILHVIPDFIITNTDGQLELNMNSRNLPELKINRLYVDMLQEYSKDKKTKSSREAATFVKQKLESAKWFIDALKQRNDTLSSVMSTIMKYQYDYFVTGDEKTLRPMILKDIADIVQMDISTVSRVANSKYVQTPFGTFLLKKLFSEALSTDSGEEVSSHEVKKILQENIEAEHKRKPLTDDQLAGILKDKGYNIARRTVAKYREQLNIPVARLRKEL